jgi:hypothetical protein
VITVVRLGGAGTTTPHTLCGPTLINIHTHWWDGSQIYGSDKTTQAQVRSGENGKLKIGPDGLIPVDPSSQKYPADEPGFWIGLAMMHTLFTLEHNAICERLRAEYPSWSDDDLFDRARLINTALLAKIHTIEWTPALLDHPTARRGLNMNWWGRPERQSKGWWDASATTK